MAEKFEMVVVDGIRYRPEDAPKKPESPAKAEKEAGKKAAEKPDNKSRTAADK